jgi:hypothetical protein
VQRWTPGSADGRFVVFMSRNDLTCAHQPSCTADSSDRNGLGDIYLRDTHLNSTRRITRSYTGDDPDGPSYQSAISGDGRYVAFVSEASNLTRHASRRAANVYVHDTITGLTALASRTATDVPQTEPACVLRSRTMDRRSLFSHWPPIFWAGKATRGTTTSTFSGTCSCTMSPRAARSERALTLATSGWRTAERLPSIAEETCWPSDRGIPSIAAITLTTRISTSFS